MRSALALGEDRLLRNNLDAERALIGAIFVENEEDLAPACTPFQLTTGLLAQYVARRFEGGVRVY